MSGLLSGIVAIYLFISLEAYLLGVTLLVISGLIDRYDGKFARKYGLENEFGRTLDSFNDLISFVVAPIILIYQTALLPNTTLCMIGTIVFISAAVFRLARFSLNDDPTIVSGLPTTVSGLTLALLVLGCYFIEGHLILKEWGLFGLLLVLSGMMVTSFKMNKG